MRNTLVLLLGLAFGSASWAQVGSIFPAMEVETVEDKKVSLPKDTKGKFTLLGLAYSKKSEDELNTWFQPVYDKFVGKAGGLFEGFGYDVNVYFIPMFTGINAAATGTAKKKAVKNITPELLQKILFYKGELKPYKETLKFDSKELPYFYVLDKDGKIVYTTSGKFSTKKLDEIESVLEE